MGHHAVLMDSRFMGKRIRSHDRLVGSDGDTGDARQQTTRSVQLLGLEIVGKIVQVPSGSDRHHQFLDRRITSPFSDTTYGTFGLSCSGCQTGERIGYGKT